MDQRIVILGGHGDGSVIAEAIAQAKAAGGSMRVIGYLNDGIEKGELIYGFPVLGPLEDWRKLDRDVRFVWALQRVGLMQERVARHRALGIPDERWAAVRHPSAMVSSTAEIGIGTYIAAFAAIQPLSRIDRFAGVRAGVNIGHHAVVEEHGYVGPNATMCGYSVLGEGACLGPNAVLIEGKTVGAYGIVGIGSAVTQDVAAHSVVMGNPARPVRVYKRPPERGMSRPSRR